MRPPVITTQQLADHCHGNKHHEGMVGLGRHYHRINSCTRKKGYPSLEYANKIIGRMGVLGMGAYRCIFCGLVHVGHKHE